MPDKPQLPQPIALHLEALKLLATAPFDFFAQAAPSPGYRDKFVFTLPQVTVYAVGQGLFASNPPVAIALSLVGAYAGLAVWTVVLRYVLLFFGQNRTFEEVAHISTCATLPFVVGWLPVVGAPALFLGTGFYCFAGLASAFHMDRGAAVAAVALPVVITGIVGVMLSFVFLWLASLSTVFGR